MNAHVLAYLTRLLMEARTPHARDEIRHRINMLKKETAK